MPLTVALLSKAYFLFCFCCSHSFNKNHSIVTEKLDLSKCVFNKNYWAIHQNVIYISYSIVEIGGRWVYGYGFGCIDIIMKLVIIDKIGYVKRTAHIQWPHTVNRFTYCLRKTKYVSHVLVRLNNLFITLMLFNNLFSLFSVFSLSSRRKV